MSNKQRCLIPAVAAILPNAFHQFYQPHYLRNLAEPIADFDSTFKVALRKAVRTEVGDLIRVEKSNQQSQNGLLTITGMLPDDEDRSKDGSTPVVDPEETLSDEVVSQILRHTHYLLTLAAPIRRHPDSLITVC